VKEGPKQTGTWLRMLSDIGIISYPNDLVFSVPHLGSKDHSSMRHHYQTQCYEPETGLCRTQHRGVQTRLDWEKARDGFSNPGLQPHWAGGRSLAGEGAAALKVEGVGNRLEGAAAVACDPSHSPYSCRAGDCLMEALCQRSSLHRSNDPFVPIPSCGKPGLCSLTVEAEAGAVPAR
jgi:hypothetical protein